MPWAADKATASPKPSPSATSIVAWLARVSALLMTRTIGLPPRRSWRAISRSKGVMPSRPSMTNRMTSAWAMACRVCVRMSTPRSSAGFVSRPAVSSSLKVSPWRFASPSRQSRVTPGVSSTIAACLPVSRLNSVDLPTFGRPAIATVRDMVPFAVPRYLSAVSVPSSVRMKTVLAATIGAMNARSGMSTWPMISPV